MRVKLDATGWIGAKNRQSPNKHCFQEEDQKTPSIDFPWGVPWKDVPWEDFGRIQAAIA
jgi:hypothetical protein